MGIIWFYCKNCKIRFSRVLETNRVGAEPGCFYCGTKQLRRLSYNDIMEIYKHNGGKTSRLGLFDTQTQRGHSLGSSTTNNGSMPHSLANTDEEEDI